MVTQTIKNNYQFMDKDFKRLGMDPNVDVYVKEVSSMMGRKEPKFDKQSMAYKTLTTTNTMFRIISFLRVTMEAGKKLKEAEKEEVCSNEDVERACLLLVVYCGWWNQYATPYER